jgi:hypothetical protein
MPFSGAVGADDRNERDPDRPVERQMMGISDLDTRRLKGWRS